MTSGKFKRVDIEQKITDRIVNLMETEGLKWVKGWTKAVGTTGWPQNAISGHEYQGINFLVTMIEAQEQGYTSNRWMTFNQIAKVGANVKGQKATQIVFWKKLKVTDRDDPDKQKDIMMAKPFNIFNLDQISDLPEEIRNPQAKTVKPITWESNDVTQFMEDAGATVRFGGNRASYNPLLDDINLPAVGQFKSRDDYAATAFHEMGHWTGHKSRLDRKFGGSFGSETYAKEELVAELTSAFLCAAWGIDAEIQHAAYMSTWITALKNDKTYVRKAASAASKAKAFIEERVQETRNPQEAAA